MLMELEFGVFVFVEEGKLETRRKILRERREPTTNSTHIYGARSDRVLGNNITVICRNDVSSVSHSPA